MPNNIVASLDGASFALSDKKRNIRCPHGPGYSCAIGRPEHPRLRPVRTDATTHEFTV
jgi:hypothetical protein